MKRALTLAAAMLGFPVIAAAQATISIDVLAAYLHVDVADTAHAAYPIPLGSLGLAPGYTVRIQPVGDWDNGPGGDQYLNMLAVFSNSATLLGPSAPDRVPDAVDCGIYAFTGATWPSGEPTDIAADFVMLDAAGVTVVIPPGATHLFVTVADIYYRDNSDPDGDFAVKITLISTPTDAPIASTRLDVLAAQPNPFEHDTSIRFEVQRAATVRLSIHDVAGRLIRTLFDGIASPGEHRVMWDGRTASGESAAPGVYFARLEDGERAQVVRMVHVR